jgi:hypothetical protein
MSFKTSVITGPERIAIFRLKTLISGCELEGKGLRRRGQSCLSILKHELGCKGSRAGVLKFAREKLAQLEE